MAELSFLGHLNILRRRFIYLFLSSLAIFAIAFAYSKPLIEWLISFVGITRYFSFSPFESLNVQVKSSLYISLLFVIPLVVFLIYSYVRDSFSDKWRRRISWMIASSFLLASVGFLLGIFIYSKMILSFLGSESIGEVMWGIDSIVGFIFLSGFIFAIISQLLVLIPLFHNIGLIDARKMGKYRSVIIAVAIPVAGWITPTMDILNLILLTLPLYGCIEGGMLMSTKEVGKWLSE